MQRVKLFACGLLVSAAAFAGCRGAEDRAYFDDLADGGPSSTSSSSSSSSGAPDAGPITEAGTDGPRPTADATIRGTVVGLTGAGLVLQNNGGDDLTVTTGGAIAFATKVPAGQPYDVTVRSQPAGPTQTCTVTNGKGVADGVDVIDILVTCATAAYPVSGTLVGLEAGKSLVLTNNGGNDITISENGTFTFANNVPSGGNFNVVVKTQPGGGNACSVSGGSGTVVTSGVDTVVVNCSPGTFTVGGNVSGLAGTLVITDAVGAIDRTISANGAFAFPAPKTNGTNYQVTVKTAPAYPPVAQTCTVTGGNGTVNGANIVSIAIACTTQTFPVGGTVSGLEAGQSIVLTNNGGNDLTLSQNAAFTFTTRIASGGNYNVVVKTQPAGKTCTVGSGSGSVTTTAVTGVVVNCTPNTFTVGGNVTGLAGQVVLSNNGVDRIVNANGNFSFPPVTTGTPYNVTVKTPPTYPPVDQTCLVEGGTGTVPAANVTNIRVTCTTKSYTVGGTVTGLTAAGLVLRNGADSEPVAAPGGAFTFDTPVASGAVYSVSVFAQPAGQFCSVTNGSGTVRSGNVANIPVSCIGGVILSENFDGVTRPALPAGWTQQDLIVPASGSTGWRSSNFENRFKSAPHAAFIPNYDQIRDFALVSPAFDVTTATTKVSFWNRYSLEEDWDGGVLEIKIGAAGTWQDILVAGGSFASGGYNCPALLNDGENPIAGRAAWCDFGVVTTVANLPAAAVGQSVQLRWRLGTDGGGDDDGWWIDDIVITSN